MAVIRSAKVIQLSQSKNIKGDIIKEVGDISKFEVLGNNLLVGTYIRPEKVGNIIRPDSNIQEDEFQGNMGLVLKTGSEEDDVFLHQWVMFGFSDGLRFRLNEVPCRIISIDRIRAIVPDPSKVL